MFWPVPSRNKLSATLNAREADGQALVKKLVEDADILLENFRPGTMERWGLSYEDLSAINPKLIMIRYPDLARQVPTPNGPGIWPLAIRMGARLALHHWRSISTAQPGRISIGDLLAAMHACLGAMMALHQVHLTGKGQVIDASIYESVLNMMENIDREYDVGDYIRERTGSFLSKIAPSNIYPTKDGIWLVIGANQDSVWTRMADAMERPEPPLMNAMPRMARAASTRSSLDELISAWTKTFSAADLEERLNEFGIPNGKIYRPPEMLVDPQFQARDSIVRVDHPEFGNIAMQNVTPRLSETQGACAIRGQRLANTTTMYGELSQENYRRNLRPRDRGII